MEKQRIFTNYPCALNALDANFQPAYRPSGRFGEQNRFFSGKHKLYGFKIECAVIKPDLAIHVSRHYPGSASDLSICLDNSEKHRALLSKTEDERQQVEYGEGMSSFPAVWGVLVDKGYQGIQTQLRGIQPTHRSREGNSPAWTSCATGGSRWVVFSWRTTSGDSAASGASCSPRSPGTSPSTTISFASASP
jgi:hypothetical protein